MNKLNYWKNEGLLVILTVLYFVSNCLLFAYHYYLLRYDDRFHYMYLLLGEVIFISRATGIVLNFNCALILLPMNRYFNSWIRTHLLKDTKSTIRRAFDHTKGIHVLVAITMSIVSVIHTVLHLVNGFSFHKNFSDAVPELNLHRSRKETTLLGSVTTVPGWTGIVMLTILMLMGLSSFKAIRKLYHEIFAWFHYLSLIFFGFLIYHGFGKMTKFQVNLEDHPILCHDLNSVVKDPICKGKAEFDFIKPSSWKWLIGPLVIHIIDRLIRFYRAMKECKVVAMRHHHDSDVVEVVFSKKNFKGKAGQYIWVQCSDISDFEWHAFTLTKCPDKLSEDDTFSVHIKVVGDWTMKLSNLVRNMTTNDEVHSKRIGDSCVIEYDEKNTDCLPVKFRVDGPYGSPHQDAFRYPVNISIATGIGITPFLATMNALKNYKKRTAEKTFKAKKMYIIWVCKSINDVSWMLGKINEVKTQIRGRDASELLDIDVFVTRAQKQNFNEITDFTTASGVQLFYRRPDFTEEILKRVNEFKKERIGVFYCGCQHLGKEIYEQVKNIKSHDNVLIFNKESFG